jgi:large subunit ribosomal protein L18
MAKLTKDAARRRRHTRVRGKVSGTTDRPRLAVYRSNTSIYAQVIDDESGHTMAAADSRLVTDGDKTARARAAGLLVAERARAAGSPRSSSTVAATCTTGASRRSPTARARED